jgi:hypothetical protein
MYVDLPTHCAALSRVLISLDWDGTDASASGMTKRAGELIFAAGGIQHVSVNVAQFDEDPGFCSNGWLEEQGQALSKSMTGLTRTLLIYGAVECLINAINPPQIGYCRGKIARACAFLLNTYEPNYQLPDHYECLLSSLRWIIPASTIQGADLIRQSDLEPGGCRGVSGVGLHTAYHLRNALAHGSIYLPEQLALEERDPDEILVVIVNRAFLLSAQMLLLAALVDNRLVVGGFRNDGSWSESARMAHDDLTNVLSSLHLQERRDFAVNVNLPC